MLLTGWQRSVCDLTLYKDAAVSLQTSLTRDVWCRYLHILRDHKDLWMSPSVQCICSFSVTRERAEQLLITQPEGTFLVRPSLSMDSTMVISTVVPSGVVHLALDHTQLEARTIEVCSPAPLALPLRCRGQCNKSADLLSVELPGISKQDAFKRRFRVCKESMFVWKRSVSVHAGCDERSTAEHVKSECAQLLTLACITCRTG